MSGKKQVTLDQALHAGLQRHNAGRLQEAEAIYRQILGQRPDHPDALHLLGVLLNQTGRAEEARALIGRAISVSPRNADYHCNLGLVLLDLGETDNAIAAFRQALAITPRHADALNNLGRALKQQGQHREGMECYRQALGIRPDYPQALNNLGIALADLGEYDDALEQFRRAIALKPDYASAHSNLLFTLSYHVLVPPAEMLDAHRQWDIRHGAEGRAHAFAHTRAGNPDKRLRIGYVSPDFRQHSVSYFLEPILAAHDRRTVEIICYAGVPAPDDVTARLKALADGWRSTVAQSDRALARMINDDGIDLLVDLAGHTAGNRLRAFTYRPAPVQATYLGYFTTTGLAAMDYWISDRVLHPVDTPEQATETIHRLPRCSVCYRPPPEAPGISRRGAGAPLTFGSFNQVSKITPATIELWSRVLDALPESRLLLKTRQLADPEVREHTLARFAACGVDRERLLLRGHTESMREHLAMYGEIDIALDTVPRTGGTTTADALWMGVPVVTLAGDRYIERLSATMLSATGLDGLIADDEAEYVATAVALAGDEPRRQTLRTSLRDRLADSELCNATGLARALEAAYREMWRRYLGEE